MPADAVARRMRGRRMLWGMDLDARERQAWLDSIRLDQPYEGRNEFFDAIWDRIGEMIRNPYLMGDVLLRNMQAFGQEGLVYLETQPALPKRQLALILLRRSTLPV